VILVDSSAWIEYYRREGDQDTASLVEAALRDGEAAVNGLILVEVAGFAASTRERELIEEDFSSCTCLQLTYALFAKAAALSFELRVHGITIPATDCVIAASAIAEGALLVHRDRHFGEIAKHFPLPQRSPLF
jgi:hypothetical protein